MLKKTVLIISNTPQVTLAPVTIITQRSSHLISSRCSNRCNSRCMVVGLRMLVGFIRHRVRSDTHDSRVKLTSSSILRKQAITTINLSTNRTTDRAQAQQSPLRCSTLQTVLSHKSKLQRWTTMILSLIQTQTRWTIQAMVIKELVVRDSMITIFLHLHQPAILIHYWTLFWQCSSSNTHRTSPNVPKHPYNKLTTPRDKVISLAAIITLVTCTRSNRQATARHVVWLIRSLTMVLSLSMFTTFRISMASTNSINCNSTTLLRSTIHSFKITLTLSLVSLQQ